MPGQHSPNTSLYSRCGIRSSEANLRPELDDAHRSPQGADLCYPRCIGSNRIWGCKSDLIRLSKIRGVQGIKGLTPKLKDQAFANRPVLEYREVEILLAGCVDDVDT